VVENAAVFFFGLGQFGGALLHQCFQVFMVAAQLGLGCFLLAHIADNGQCFVVAADDHARFVETPLSVEVQAVVEVLHLVGFESPVDLFEEKGRRIGRQDVPQVLAEVGVGRPVAFRGGALETLEDALPADTDDHVRNGVDDGLANTVVHVTIDLLQGTDCASLRPVRSIPLIAGTRERNQGAILS